MPTLAATPALSKRGLFLHDSLTFVTLTASSILLFIVTLLLFRSFETHRADLATEWAKRGTIALQQHRPEDAVFAFRTALSYAPDERPDQFLLAQALASAGHTEEATNYFLNLWDARPGDGFINLQLARLSRKKAENKEAADYYRASIYGSWDENGILRRREVRLEFVDFLLQQRQFSEARNELFTISGNAPDDIPLTLLLAQKLETAQAPQDALAFYERALAAEPRNADALSRAGTLAYSLGDYPKAETLLQRALASEPPSDQVHAIDLLHQQAQRIQELSLTRDQPAGDRASHILLASRIAQERLKSCLGSAVPSADNAALLSGLNNDWNAATAGGRAKVRTLLENASNQDTWTQLIARTEQRTAQVCGAPHGDDALLLQLANSAQGIDRAGKVSDVR